MFTYKPSSRRVWPQSSPPMSMFLRIVREPLRQSRVALRTKKDIFTLIHRIMSSYFSPDFTLIFSANVLWNLEHSWLIAPEVVNISGVNVPCSTSITRRLYSRFFSISCFLRMLWIEDEIWLSDSAFVTRTSKNAFCPGLQKPLDLMSNLASSLMFADFWKFPGL